MVGNFRHRLVRSICYDMTWHDMRWDEMRWDDVIWYDMIWYDMIWYDMIWYEMILEVGGGWRKLAGREEQVRGCLSSRLGQESGRRAGKEQEKKKRKKRKRRKKRKGTKRRKKTKKTKRTKTTKRMKRKRMKRKRRGVGVRSEYSRDVVGQPPELAKARRLQLADASFRDDTILYQIMLCYIMLG